MGRKIFDGIIASNQEKIVTAADFSDLLSTMGLSAQWLYKQFDNLIEAGRVVKHKDGHAVSWEIMPDLAQLEYSRSE